MKQLYFIMPLLIPGPEQPANDIDVYLEPLLDELKDVWIDGLNTYGASQNGTF